MQRQLPAHLGQVEPEQGARPAGEQQRELDRHTHARMLGGGRVEGSRLVGVRERVRVRVTC